MGYEPTIPKEMMKFNGSLIFEDFKNLSQFFAIDYVLTPLSPREENLKKLFQEGIVKPVAISSEDNLALLKVTSKTSLYYMKNSKIEVIEDKGDTRKINIVSFKKEDSILTIKENYHSGWSASIKGTKLVSRKGKYNRLEFKVPKELLNNQTIVRLSFSPTSFKLGAILSLLGFFLALIFIIRNRINSRQLH